MKETIVEFKNDSQYGEYKKGDTGYFLSTVFNGTSPYLVIANESNKNIVLCKSYEVIIIS